MPTTRITDLSFTGEGVGREKGKVVFLPFTLPGEVVEWEPTESKKHFDRGLPRRLMEASPNRILPLCPLFQRCGGCQLQHLDFQKQAEEKEKLFRKLLVHALKTEAVPFLPPLLSLQGFGYRHRLRLKTARQGKVLQLGFYNRRSRELVPLKHCFLANKAVNALLPILTETLQILKPEDGEPEIELSATEDPLKGGAVIELPKPLDRLKTRKLEQSLLLLPGLDYLFFRMPGSYALIGEKPFDPEQHALEYSLPSGVGTELKMSIFPSVFSQPHLEVNRRLIAELLSLPLFDPASILIDLYSGMGNLSLPLAPLFRRLLAWEIFPPAVTNGKWNIQRNGLLHCTFREGAAEEAGKLLSSNQPKWVLLDPPRSGIKEVVRLLNAGRKSIQGVFYLSCHPLTLLHDLHRLMASTWKIAWVRMVDFFPQTFHQEWLVHLTP